tara:strand:+ start:171 stop:872 length:702 start_codon:yes stop_codon:yes gene_type:complete
MRTVTEKEITSNLDALLEDIDNTQIPVKIQHLGKVQAGLVSTADLERILDLKANEAHTPTQQSPHAGESARDSAGFEGETIAVSETHDTNKPIGSSEQRYRELFDDSPVAIWVEDWSAIKRLLEKLASDGIENFRSYFGNNRDALMQAYGTADIVEISQAAITLFNEDSVDDLLAHTEPTEVVDEELDSFLDIVISFWDDQFSLDIESKDIDGNREEIIIRRRVSIPPAHQLS